jgi:hypothetical protein
MESSIVPIWYKLILVRLTKNYHYNRRNILLNQCTKGAIKPTAVIIKKQHCHELHKKSYRMIIVICNVRLFGLVHTHTQKGTCEHPYFETQHRFHISYTKGTHCSYSEMQPNLKGWTPLPLLCFLQFFLYSCQLQIKF